MVVRYLTKSPNNPTFLIETSVQGTMIDGKAEFPMFKFEGFIR